MKELETRRLRLRKLTSEDAPSIYHGWAKDDEVTKFLTWDTHQSIDTTREILDSWLTEYHEDQTVRYGIELKENSELIGMIDVVDFIDGYPEVGYVLKRKNWGQGIMTEAFSAVVNYLFLLGYKKVYIKAEENNVGSNAVILKNHFQLIKQETQPRSAFKEDLVKLNIYEKVNPNS